VITCVAVHGYRSLADLVVPLGPLTVITGANGTGKSSVYRALRLLADAASGQLIGSLARSGGLPQVLWAGPENPSGAARRGLEIQGTSRRTGPVGLMLGFASDGFSYLIDVGYPTPSGTAFHLDPVIKREHVFAGPVLRPASLLVERRGGSVFRQDAGRRAEAAAGLADRESIVGELADPVVHPELHAVRRMLRSWRFYDSFRVDDAAPARAAQVGTWTPVLSGDGSDLASAMQTIFESGNASLLLDAVADAFDGARPDVAQLRLPGDPSREATLFQVVVHQPGLLRSMSAAELSEGTLRFLLVATALLSPRPPGLLVLNEPEASLYPGVLPALARLILRAARATQVVVVSHSAALVEAITGAGASGVVAHELVKHAGSTEIVGQKVLDRPAWNWGKR